MRPDTEWTGLAVAVAFIVLALLGLYQAFAWMLHLPYIGGPK